MAEKHSNWYYTRCEIKALFSFLWGYWSYLNEILFLLEALSNSSKEFRLDYTGPISAKTNGDFTCSVFLVKTPVQPDDVDEKPESYRVVYVSQPLKINDFRDGKKYWLWVNVIKDQNLSMRRIFNLHDAERGCQKESFA